MWTRGEGVKKSQHFADVICGWPHTVLSIDLVATGLWCHCLLVHSWYGGTVSEYVRWLFNEILPCIFAPKSIHNCSALRKRVHHSRESDTSANCKRIFPTYQKLITWKPLDNLQNKRSNQISQSLCNSDVLKCWTKSLRSKGNLAITRCSHFLFYVYPP